MRRRLTPREMIYREGQSLQKVAKNILESPNDRKVETLEFLLERIQSFAKLSVEFSAEGSPEDLARLKKMTRPEQSETAQKFVEKHIKRQVSMLDWSKVDPGEISARMIEKLPMILQGDGDLNQRIEQVSKAVAKEYFTGTRSWAEGEIEIILRESIGLDGRRTEDAQDCDQREQLSEDILRSFLSEPQDQPEF